MKMMCLICLMTLCGVCVLGCQSELCLVRAGRACAGLSARSGDHPAGRRLAEMVKRVTGAAIEAGREEVTIFVGPAAAAEAGLELAGLALGDEGYVIRAKPGRLVLAGLNDRSTDYAVSTFLERYAGVRWLWPHELGTVVPKKDSLVVPVGEWVERPDFAIRWIGNDESWARCNKLNVVREKDIGVGFKWFVHTWLDLVPPARYAEENPEYYAMIDGKRQSPSRGRHTQLCTSNPQVADAAAATILEIARQEPNIKIVSVDPMDTDRFCQCQACRALDEDKSTRGRRHSRRVALFYRALAERVRKHRPELLLKGIAYWSYVEPPADASIRLPDNVVIQLCRFECHNHGLDDPGCPFNAKHVASLQGWQKIAKQMLLYEYYWKVAWDELPFPIAHTLKADMPYLKKLGVMGVASQHARNFGSHGQGYYLAAKLLWDAEADVDALVEDYHVSLFGQEAGRELLGYYYDVERAAVASGVDIAVQRPYREVLTVFTPQLLERLEARLRKAEASGLSEVQRERVRLVRIAHDHLVNVVGYLRTVDKAVSENAKAKLTDEQKASLGQRAAAIADFVKRHSKTGAISGVNSYTRALTRPEHVASCLCARKEPHRSAR